MGDCQVRLLSRLLRRFIRQGTLRVRDADGEIQVFGNRLPGPEVAIHLHDRKLYTKLFVNPELYAAEAYMDNTLTLEDGATIHDFLLLFSINRAGLYAYGSQKLMRGVWRGLRRWHQANPIGLAAAHARHHYDLSTELYRLFLDSQMQYSCAYFRNPEHETLEQAQRNKLIHGTSKLQLKPGTTGAFIRKYIFPGAYVPSLSETFAATERCGLWCDDMEVLRLHYYYTVKHWRERFANNRARAAAIYDERFCRMWEFYLAAVELEFLHGSHMVFQILLSTKRDAVPITRDFMIDFERAALARARDG